MGQIQYSEKYFDDTYEYRFLLLISFVSWISIFSDKSIFDWAIVCFRFLIRLCRHVVLPPEVAKLLPKNRLLSEVSSQLRFWDSFVWCFLLLFWLIYCCLVAEKMMYTRYQNPYWSLVAYFCFISLMDPVFSRFRCWENEVGVMFEFFILMLSQIFITELDFHILVSLAFQSSFVSKQGIYTLFGYR